MKKKLELDNLNIQSFVTGVKGKRALKGGWRPPYLIQNPSVGVTDCGACESVFCDTWGGAGCHTQGCTADCP